MTNNIMTGFLIRRGAIPKGWIWMHWISFYKYMISFLVANELSGLSFYCPNNNGAVLLPFDKNDNNVNLNDIVMKSGGAITCAIISSGSSDSNNMTLPCYACPITTGDGMLNVFDMPTSLNDRTIMLGCIVAWLIFYRLTAFLSLHFKNHVNK
jgi:hypothetical protein